MAHLTKSATHRTSRGRKNPSKPRASPKLAAEDDYQPRTPLGRRLMELRKKIVASGEPLLDWNDLEREVAERRGGVEQDES